MTDCIKLIVRFDGTVQSRSLVNRWNYLRWCSGFYVCTCYALIYHLSLIWLKLHKIDCLIKILLNILDDETRCHYCCFGSRPCKQMVSWMMKEYFMCPPVIVWLKQLARFWPEPGCKQTVGLSTVNWKVALNHDIYWSCILDGARWMIENRQWLMNSSCLKLYRGWTEGWTLHSQNQRYTKLTNKVNRYFLCFMFRFFNCWCDERFGLVQGWAERDRIASLTCLFGSYLWRNVCVAIFTLSTYPGSKPLSIVFWENQLWIPSTLEALCTSETFIEWVAFCGHLVGMLDFVVFRLFLCYLDLSSFIWFEQRKYDSTLLNWSIQRFSARNVRH